MNVPAGTDALMIGEMLRDSPAGTVTLSFAMNEGHHSRHAHYMSL